MRTTHAHAFLALVGSAGAFRPSVPLKHAPLTRRYADGGVSTLEKDEARARLYQELAAVQSPGQTGLTELYDSTFTSGSVPEAAVGDAWLEAVNTCGQTGLTAMYDATYTAEEAAKKKEQAPVVTEEPATEVSDDGASQLENPHHHHHHIASAIIVVSAIIVDVAAKHGVVCCASCHRASRASPSSSPTPSCGNSCFTRAVRRMGAGRAGRPLQITLEYRGPAFFTGASQKVSKGDSLTHGAKGEVIGPATSEAYEGKGVAVLFPGNTASVNCYLGTLSATEVASSTPIVEVHAGFSCDASGVNPIVGPRFRKGDNYDVCEAEFIKLDGTAQAAFVRCPPPPTTVPGGYSVGDAVVYTGSTQTFGDGDSVKEGGEGEVVGPATSEAHQGKSVAVLFPGNKGSIECPLTMLERKASSDEPAPVAEAAPVAAKAAPAVTDNTAWLEAVQSPGQTGLTALYDLTAPGASVEKLAGRTIDPETVAAIETEVAAAESEELKGLFAMIDSNNDGVIQPGELQEWLSGNGISLSIADVYAMYALHDDNNDGVLQEDEFAELLRQYEAEAATAVADSEAAAAAAEEAKAKAEAAAKLASPFSNLRS